MTYFDDPTTPAAPFSGDQSGLDYPDHVLQSPTTTERMVDTQSGFLLVVKRMGERLALSCKRRVGTPPTSAILLTPDESVKLSKILAHSLSGLEDSLHGDDAMPRIPSTAPGGRRRFPFVAESPAKKQAAMRRVMAPAKIAIAIAVLGTICGGAFFAGKQFGGGTTHGAAVAADALSMTNVDRFSRRFVSEMLDFNPDTYKLSQVQAMAAMSPELLEKYWKETNFPLSRRQLKALPEGTTVMITRISQERVGPTEMNADIYAQLVRSDSKLSSPVHIKLKLGVSEENTIRVLEQEDLSAVGVSQ
jgi:hypothetical protein